MEGKVKCPVCGQYYFDEPHDFDICQVCFWINDEHQIRDPDLILTNPMSLNEAREAYKKGLPIRNGLIPRRSD